MDGGGIPAAPTGGAGANTINRRRVRLFFQRFPGTSASSGIQGLAFTVTIGTAPPRNGTTAADGKVEFLLAAGETAAVRILGSTYDVQLLVGGLFSVTQLRGVQQRLNMLGYQAGALETPVAPAAPVLARTGFNQNVATEHAIVNFQTDHAPLLIDGIAGANTQPRLRQVLQAAGGE